MKGEGRDGFTPKAFHHSAQGCRLRLPWEIITAFVNPERVESGVMSIVRSTLCRNRFQRFWFMRFFRQRTGVLF